MAAGKPNPDGYMKQLDGLRALAALAVVAQHSLPESIYPKFLGEWQPRIGVRLFFVLSGFLITGILLRCRDQASESESPGGSRRAFSTFYARRFLRIFPLYYLVLFAAAIVNLPDVRRDFWWHLSYLSNYLVCRDGIWPETLGHFWSLGVEEQFYLLWPAFVLLTPRKWLLPAFVATFALANVSYAVVYKMTDNWIITSFVTPSNLDALVAGALMALFRHEGRDAVARRWGRVSLVAGIALGLAGILLAATGRGPTVSLTLAHAANALVFTWLVDGAARGFGGIGGRLLTLPPLVYVGTISYGIYVYHVLIPPVLERIATASGIKIPWPDQDGLAKFGCLTAAAVAVASLSWWGFEKPLNDLKRYFPYRAKSRSGAVEEAEPTGSPAQSSHALTTKI